MNEVNIHFKINEYLIKLETKNDLIKELKIELENLDIKNKELHEKKNKLKAEFNKKEKSNKNLVNIYNSSNYNQINNKSQPVCNINKSNNTNNLKMKRNLSAAIIKRKIDKESINELKRKNEELKNKLLVYKSELNKLINNVNNKEINCKMVMLKAKNHSKFYSH